MGRSSDDEFPLLAAHGLYAANIRGDGNCLFNALSDQIYGNQNEHHKIRARVIEYMREHASYYKQFIDVHAGGGIRRNPKRKNAGAYSTPISTLPPTADEAERVFEAHLTRMAKGGTYGDNMEISAFSAAFRVDVKIYQRDFAYMVSGGPGGGGAEKRAVAHIAYHVWEHYSSIRNINGPHTGLPNVQMDPLSPGIEQNHAEKLGHQAPVIPSWMIEVAMQSLPHMVDKSVVKRTLEEYNGNLDNAVSKLLDAEDRGSISSARDSSSVEREPDSDEDVQLSGNGPNKKQDRRLSKATRQILKLNHRARESSEASEVIPRIDITLEGNGDEKAIRRGMINTDEDSDWRPALSSDNTNTNKDDDTTGSEYSDISFKPQSRPATTSTTSRNPFVEDGPAPKKNPTSNFLHRQHSQPQKQKRITARERKEMKKAAQKAAAKQRKQAAVATAATATSSTTTTTPATTTTTASTTNKTTSLTIRMGKENTPVIAQAIKTLYI